MFIDVLRATYVGMTSCTESSSSGTRPGGASSCWPTTSKCIRRRSCLIAMSSNLCATGGCTDETSVGSVRHLLASALVGHLRLWTTDPALATAAKELGIAYE